VPVRRLILRIGMLLMGIGLVGGALATQIGTALAGLDQQVGTNGSAAAFVLGAGLIVASLSPSAPIAWVRAGILYGLVVVVFEVVSTLHGKSFHLGPVIFGLAFTLLLIAAYPERRKLISDPTSQREPAMPPEKKPAPVDAEPEEPEKPS